MKKSIKKIPVTIVDQSDKNIGAVQQWTLKKVLEEVNKDSSELWEDYNENDWYEGWKEWVQGEFYSIDESFLRPPNYFFTYTLKERLCHLLSSFFKKTNTVLD